MGGNPNGFLQNAINLGAVRGASGISHGGFDAPSELEEGGAACLYHFNVNVCRLGTGLSCFSPRLVAFAL